MTEETWALIDLERYADIAARLLSRPVSLIAVHGDAPAATVGSDAAAATPLLAALDESAPGWREAPAPMELALDDRQLVVFGFVDRGGQMVSHLLASYSNGVEAIDGVGALEALIHSVEAEFRLNGELLVMSEELTARYEELNLVYDTQDQASDYEESHEQLRMLVANSCDYMNVAFATLVLKDKKVTLCDMQPDLPADDVRAALRQLKGQMYDWVLATRQVAVMNEVGDRLRSVLCPGLPYRVAVAPVLSGTSTVTGVLIIARTYAQPAFTNNDKNLLDVMARKASKIIQVSYDGQTGLMKRSGFEHEVGRAMHANRTGEQNSVVFVIDIDRMQVINDTLGYEAGDRVVCAVAEAVQSVLRAADSTARLGGDEFGVLLVDCDLEAARRVAVKICEAVEQYSLEGNGQTAEVHVSIGVAPIDGQVDDVDVVMASAEVACSAVKDRGGNGVSTYQAGNEEMVRRRSQMDMVGRIQETLRADRFELHCQPILPLQASAHPHGEVLVRMLGEDGALIPPGLFLPAAERYHLMPAIDRWVVTRAVHMVRDNAAFMADPCALISINLSGQTLSDDAFAGFVDELIETSGVRAASICFEITETTAIGDTAQAKRFIGTLRDRGVRFSLDDFGTGLSTFSYLKELPVDFLKIDGSFVKAICDDPVAETMVSAINDVAHTMNLKTVGEFVENDAICARLAELGVDYGQGYGLGKPAPFVDYLARLSRSDLTRNAG